MKKAGNVGMLAVVLLAVGCGKPPAPAPKAHVRPDVKVVDVAKRTIVRIAGQPGFIEAYEQTSMFAKVSGFVKNWNVDIGDVITKGQVLANLDVPDLVAEYQEKKAEVTLAEVRINVAKEMVKVAEENWKNAKAQVSVAKADLGKYVADVEFRKGDYDRIKDLYVRKAVEKPVLDTKYKDWKTSIAFKEAADAGVIVAEATEAARKADVDKAKVDVSAAIAKTKVAKRTEERLAALVGYTSIKAPYNGVVVARNVNTGDFVQPSGGDQASPRSLQEAPRARTIPLYVLARTDKVRIFLDVPEMEASGARVGNRVWVNIEAVDNLEVAATVTRTSWGLNAKTRTLQAEVDIPNPEGRIQPNMYAFGKVEMKRSGVWAMPLEAVAVLGNQTSCYEFQDGKAVLLPIQRGIDDGAWVEVVKKKIKGEWVPLTGSERIIVGDLTQLADGEAVRAESSSVSSQ